MRRPSGGGPERFLLGLALLIPLVFAVLVLAQVPGVTLAAPSSVLRTEADANPVSLSKRPVSSSAGPPPTLAPSTPTPKPTATPVPPPTPTPTPEKGRRYTVKAGDELKHIAADYKVDIFKLIRNNDIPDPDSLKIGQVLRIPDD
jgi:LysM repeat protein